MTDSVDLCTICRNTLAHAALDAAAALRDMKLAPLRRRQGVSRMDGLKKLRQTLIRRLVRRGALPHEAEDAIHEAFVRLYRAQQKEPVRNPAAFLTDVTMKVRIEHWRSARRHERLFVGESVEELEVIDLSPQPEDYLQAEQRLDRMWKRLGELSPRTREIFFQNRIQGLTCKQIAGLLRLSVSAVEKHIARAAFALADELNSE